LKEVASQLFPTAIFSNRYVISTIVMPCFFSVIGQVASVSAGIGGSHQAVVLIKEGPLRGPGEDRYFEVSFWPEGETNLITNKHYLLRGTVVLAEVLADKREELPKVEHWNLLLLGLLTSFSLCYHPASVYLWSITVFQYSLCR
jgi:hypothetical protein